MRLIFATGNTHKLEEAQAILTGVATLIPSTEAGVHQELPEDFDTLEENSLQKAEFVYTATGLDCFADDTGLEVEALHGAPGAYSARYAGPGCTPEDNVRKMLREMAGQTHRAARFRTVITLILGGIRHQFEGIVEGEILHEVHGAGGFGYDPIFRPSGHTLSFAEMPPTQKNALSHRGRALQAMATFLRTLR